MPPEQDWEGLIGYLIDVVHQLHLDRLLPKYQFERHVDVMLVPFLPEILERRLGGKFQLVASEFPLKKLEGNQSTNADALLYQRFENDPNLDTWWLFELKTDQASVKPDQLEPYARACERRMSDLVADVETITANSPTGAHKYRVVQQRLKAVQGQYDGPMRLVYLSPWPVTELEQITGVEAITFDDLLEVDLQTRPAAWQLVRRHLLGPVVGR